MGLIEDLRTIKERREGPIFKIERDQANARLKEAMDKRFEKVNNFIQFRRTPDQKGTWPGCVHVEIRGKVDPEHYQEKIVADIPSMQVEPDYMVDTRYQYSGSGILLKRESFNRRIDHEYKRDSWKVVPTDEIEILADFVQNPSANRVATAFVASSIVRKEQVDESGSLKLKLRKALRFFSSVRNIL